MHEGLRGYPFQSMGRNAGRTALLASLVAVLSFAMLAGTVLVESLRGGLASLTARLGADVIVAPQTARSTDDLEELLVEGVPGNFYMDRSYVGRVAEVEGVGQVAPQYYLATAKAGCCALPLQIVGIDPTADFSIRPWIARSYSDELGFRDVVVGCGITGSPGSPITFYGHECTIVAKLDETGTALDNAVFCTDETVKDLIAGSVEQGMSVLADRSPDEVVSTVQVRVEDGYSPQSVADDINVHVRGAWAVASNALTSGVAEGMEGVSGAIAVGSCVVWALAVVVLVVAFTVAGRHRRREFAVLRVVGATRRSLVRVVMVEALCISLVGSLVGVALALAASVLFNDAVEVALGLPYLMPDAPAVCGIAVLTVAVSCVVGCGAAACSAIALSKVDAGQSLREE